MLTIALGLFVAAALFGLYMASRVLRGALAPWPAAILHGLLAASGLGVVIYAVVTGLQSTPILIGGGLLVAAALGGFVLASFHLRKAVAPRALVIVHALAAVGGVGVLIGEALGLI